MLPIDATLALKEKKSWRRAFDPRTPSALGTKGLHTTVLRLDVEAWSHFLAFTLSHPHFLGSILFTFCFVSQHDAYLKHTKFLLFIVYYVLPFPQKYKFNEGKGLFLTGCFHLCILLNIWHIVDVQWIFVKWRNKFLSFTPIVSWIQESSFRTNIAEMWRHSR